MKILRMKATFGCLDEAELMLKPGLNVLTLPNEHGKSTWAAFLMAMFYGVDTTQRAAKGKLPDKTRYQPWNGKEMTGFVELEHEGRVVVLQRTASRTKPMGDLQAYDKATGLPLKEVTAENCGLYFLGVERSVFARSGFLRGEELAVTEDTALARRLENLAVSGDSEDSYPAAAARLKQWKNRIRYHRSGLLPDVEAQLEQVERELAELQAVKQRQAEAESALEEARQTLAQLEQEEALQWQWEKERTAAALTEAMEQWESQFAGQKSAGTAIWPVLAGLTALLAAVGSRLSPWCWSLLLLWILWGFLWWKNRPKKMPDDARQAVEQARLASEMAAMPRTPGEELLALQKTAAALERELEVLRREAQFRGNATAQECRREELLQKQQTLSRQEEALAMAQMALEEARQQQAQVYAPPLTKAAGAYLSRLTGGKYHGLILEQGFSLQVLEARSGLARPMTALSSGARDQVWLALRLAMTKLLLPEKCPIWLDDALLTFDDHRTDLALDVLSKENRQVILMGCK